MRMRDLKQWYQRNDDCFGYFSYYSCEVILSDKNMNSMRKSYRDFEVLLLKAKMDEEMCKLTRVRKFSVIYSNFKNMHFIIK